MWPQASHIGFISIAQNFGEVQLKQKTVKYQNKNSAKKFDKSGVLELLFHQHVMYLRELRLAQMERIMAEFIYGVDIYLGVVRDAKEVNPKVRFT